MRRPDFVKQAFGLRLYSLKAQANGLLYKGFPD